MKSDHECSHSLVVLEHSELNNALVTASETSNSKLERTILKEIVHDFQSDRKILRAIQRTAFVNGAVTVTVLTAGTGGSIVGFLTGGAITAKRFGEGIRNEDEKEVAKSLAVYGSATCASVVGQAVAGAILLSVVHLSLPVVAPIAFGVGCCSGVSAGALSEWGVDSAASALSKQGVNSAWKKLVGRFHRSLKSEL